MELQEKLKTEEQPSHIATQDVVIYTEVEEVASIDSNNDENLEIVNEKDIVYVNVETQCSTVDSIDGRKESNQFASKKATAEGMMDVALLTANANQLRFLMAYNTHSKTYVLILVLIILSLVLQTVVGFAFICKRYWKCRNDKRKTRILREFLVAAVFLITLINIFVATFSTTD